MADIVNGTSINDVGNDFNGNAILPLDAGSSNLVTGQVGLITNESGGLEWDSGDLFLLFVRDPGVYEIILSGLDDNLDLYLFRSQGTDLELIASSKNTGSLSDMLSFNFTDTQDSFYLRVDDEKSVYDATDYTLTVAAPGAVDPVDPDPVDPDPVDPDPVDPDDPSDPDSKNPPDNPDEQPGNTLTGPIMNGGDGSFTFDGTIGFNTVIYDDLLFEDLTIQPSGDASPEDGLALIDKLSVSYQVDGDGGSSSKSGGTGGGQNDDTLIMIERIQTQDKTLALDVGLEESAGMAMALLYAGFNQLPSAEMIAGIIAKSDEINNSASSAYEAMVDLAEFTINTFYPNGISNESAVNLLYKNLQGSLPSEEVLQAYVTLIEDGSFTQASLFTYMAKQPGNIEPLQALLEDGVEFTDFEANDLIGFLGSLTIQGTDAIDFADYSHFDLDELSLNVNGQPASGEFVPDNWTINFSDDEGGTKAGTDNLQGIERVKYEDGVIALDLNLDDSAGMALALLYAGFGELPSDDVIGQWIAESDEINESANDASSAMLDLAEEIITSYAPNGWSNEDLVTILYSNIAKQGPTQTQVNEYVGLIGTDSGQFATQAELYVWAASMSENTSHYAADLLGGVTYEPAQDAMG